MLRQAFIALRNNNIIIVTTSCLSNYDTIYKRVILIVSDETSQKYNTKICTYDTWFLRKSSLEFIKYMRIWLGMSRHSVTENKL